jgi:hypothetical protein
MRKKRRKIILPCKNCITYPICFSQTRDVYSLITFLSDKCTIFSDFCMNTKSDFEESSNEIICLFGSWSIAKNIRLNPKL